MSMEENFRGKRDLDPPVHNFMATKIIAIIHEEKNNLGSIENVTAV